MAGPRHGKDSDATPGASSTAMRWLWAAQAVAVIAGFGIAHAQTQPELRNYQQRLQQLFLRLDQNGDQRLERGEVEGQPYLQRHFERLDQQKRGYLTPADLRPPAGATAGQERARQFFKRADRNGDGQLDKQEAEPYPWLQRRFSEADRNGDGKLSGEELRQLRTSGNGGASQPALR